jgi:hypothetical protein
MAAGSSLPRRVYDTVENPVGDALAAGARSGTFGDVLALAVRVPRGVQREIERRTRRALHFANLPTATDVRRLTQQVTELHRDVRSLSRDLERRAVAGDFRRTGPRAS